MEMIAPFSGWSRDLRKINITPRRNIGLLLLCIVIIPVSDAFIARSTSFRRRTGNPSQLDARRNKLKKPQKNKKKVDYAAVEQALGTFETKVSPADRDLVPACTFSTTFGLDDERLMVDGRRVLFRNGFVDSNSRKWVSNSGPPTPHLYDIGEATKMGSVKEDDETPQMIIDSNGFAWRAAHVLEQIGLQRNKMGSPEHETINVTSGELILLPKPWEGPLTPSAMKKASSSKKLRGDSRIGCELDDERWLVHYTKLVNFCAMFGHADIPLMWEEDRALGKWATKQRVLYRKYERNNYYQHEVLPGEVFGRKINTLSPWRIQMLYDLGFSFKIKLRWEDRLAQLARFYIQYGHTRVPCSDNLSATEEEFPGLYLWILQQRTEYQRWKKGIPGATMTEERLALLAKFGLDLKPLDSNWESRLDQLRAFKDEHGHIRVTKRHDFGLATWLIHRRKQYRLYHSDTPWESSLTKKMIDELNELGMDWEPLETKWQEQFETLKAFSNKHGHANVPVEYTRDKSLALWVQKQREMYKQGTLMTHHETQLKELNFVFDMRREYFDKGIVKLEAYKDIHGDCMVSSSCPDKELLGFVQNLRTQYRKWQKGESSTLNEERRQLLDDLGFVWSVQSTVWDEQYLRLFDFKSEFGHCNVPKNFTDSSLYRFVMVQRREYKHRQSGKSKSMTPERLAKLESIGFSWNTNKNRWMLRYSELQDFRKQYGHSNVPIKYKENAQLGAWVRNQRVQYRYLKNDKKSTLSPARIDLLEKLDFQWSVRDYDRES